MNWNSMYLFSLVLLISLLFVIPKKDFPKDTIDIAIKKSKSKNEQDNPNFKKHTISKLEKEDDDYADEDEYDVDELGETDDEEDDEDEGDEEDDENDEDEDDDDDENGVDEKNDDEVDDDDNEDEDEDEDDEDEDEDNVKVEADSDEDDDEDQGEDNVDDDDDEQEDEDYDDDEIEEESFDVEDDDEIDEDEDDEEDYGDEGEEDGEDEEEEEDDDDDYNEEDDEDDDDEEEEDDDEDEVEETEDYEEEEEEEEDIVLPSSAGDSPYAFVFSWHVAERKNDYRWGSTTVGKGNEFRVSVISVHNAHPNIPIYLFTNSKNIDSDLRDIITVVKVDLMEEGDLYDLLEQTQDSKVGFGTKPQSLIYGWEKGILPDKVLYLDVDIIIGPTNEEYNLLRIFDPLEYFDFTACFEGFAIGPKPYPAVGNGWEANTGVLGVRREALPFIRDWLETFKSGQDQFGQYLSGEQQAFMVTLQNNPKYRIFPLPNVYNFRRPALWPITGPHLPVVMQTHVYSDERMKVEQYLEVHKHSAAVTFEDCYHHLIMRGGPMHYLCDVMAG